MIERFERLEIEIDPVRRTIVLNDPTLAVDAPPQRVPRIDLRSAAPGEALAAIACTGMTPVPLDRIRIR